MNWQGPWELHVRDDGCYGLIECAECYADNEKHTLRLDGEDANHYYIIRFCDLYPVPTGIAFESRERPIYNEVIEP